MARILFSCKHCRKIAVSIRDWVDGILHVCGRSVALVSTEPLTEKSVRDISWGVKAAGA